MRDDFSCEAALGPAVEPSCSVRLPRSWPSRECHFDPNTSRLANFSLGDPASESGDAKRGGEWKVHSTAIAGKLHERPRLCEIHRKRLLAKEAFSGSKSSTGVSEMGGWRRSDVHAVTCVYYRGRIRTASDLRKHQSDPVHRTRRGIPNTGNANQARRLVEHGIEHSLPHDAGADNSERDRFVSHLQSDPTHAGLPITADGLQPRRSA